MSKHLGSSSGGNSNLDEVDPQELWDSVQFTFRQEVAWLESVGGIRFSNNAKALVVSNQRSKVGRQIVELEKWYPLEESELLRTTTGNRFALTSFLSGADHISADFNEPTARIRTEYDRLYQRYKSDQSLTVGAIADLTAMRIEAERTLAAGASVIANHLKDCRRVLAVLQLGAMRSAAPEEVDWDDPLTEKLEPVDAVRGYFGHYIWKPLLHGSRESWRLLGTGSLSAFGEPEMSYWLLQLQKPAIDNMLDRRDQIIESLVPVEFLRIATEVLLRKLVSGDLVGAWSQADTESVLPAREEFEPKSPQSRKVVFDLADFLNDERSRGIEWENSNSLYRAYASGTKKTKREINKEVDRIRKSIDRTLTRRHVFLEAATDKEYVSELIGWLDGVRRRHAST